MCPSPEKASFQITGCKNTSKLSRGGGEIRLRGTAGYYGPHVPSGATSWYHFEVFALDTRLNLDPATADRQAVVNALKNHVLTSGEIIANSTGK
ncbi:MAG TPA: hypothetical protein VIX14_01490 [Terriglobales bacterium]